MLVNGNIFDLSLIRLRILDVNGHCSEVWYAVPIDGISEHVNRKEVHHGVHSPTTIGHHCYGMNTLKAYLICEVIQ